MIWRQLAFDGTGKDGKDFVTCSIRTVNTKTGVEKTICLRGAFLTDNKTSQCEAEGVRDRANSRKISSPSRRVR